MSAIIQAAITLIVIGSLLVISAFALHRAATLPQPRPERETLADRLDGGDD